MPRMTPSEAMVETLRVEGITDVPGIVGSAFMDALDLFPAAGIRFLPVRHEQGAAHMADGYARVSGRVGVCIGQNGPGITNMVTGIAAAYQAHSPVIIVTPSATSGSVGLDGFQEVEQLSIFRSITKFQIQVPRPDRMAESFRTAFRMATSLMGPVQIGCGTSRATSSMASRPRRSWSRTNTAPRAAARATPPPSTRPPTCWRAPSDR